MIINIKTGRAAFISNVAAFQFFSVFLTVKFVQVRFHSLIQA